MNSATTIWQAALGEFELQVSRPNFRTWFKDTTALAYDGETFLVGAPNAFVAEYLEKTQCSLIEKTLIGLIHRSVNVRFKVVWATDGETPRPGNDTAALYGFNPRYTFDNFVVGAGNRLAHAAALGVARHVAEATYNPLFLYAGPGLGKTHLLHAIGQEAVRRGQRPVYVSGEQFTREFVEAIRERRADDFRARYRAADLLMVDDIHAIGGKEQTQECFFNTFNELHNAGRQIIITSDRSPREMPLLEERLRSRFAWGLMADIQPPDYETRRAILLARAEDASTELTPDVLEMLAGEARHNIRELEGSLNRIIAYASLLRAEVTTELACQAIKDISPHTTPLTLGAPDLALKLVAQSFALTVDDILGRQRNKEIAQARQVAMYLLKQYGSQSLAEIGHLLGGRGASTVSHACEKISRDMEASPVFRRQVEDIRQKLDSK
ncbi:MAG: chromosomal replication initiator protein DnaA [Dehalococcoidia bacterium]|nr:chromosomal replication initiator protein DnaA [Dehalococcoidia bacterium]